MPPSKLNPRGKTQRRTVRNEAEVDVNTRRQWLIRDTTSVFAMELEFGDRDLRGHSHTHGLGNEVFPKHS